MLHAGVARAIEHGHKTRATHRPPHWRCPLAVSYAKMWLTSILGAPNDGSVSPSDQCEMMVEDAHQQQRHTLAAFVLIATFNSLRAYVPQTGAWKAARSAMLAFAVSYVAFIGAFVSRDAVMLLPRLLSNASASPSMSPALSWCAAAYAMLLLQLISLPEVQDAFAARVTPPKGREYTMLNAPSSSRTLLLRGSPLSSLSSLLHCSFAFLIAATFSPCFPESWETFLHPSTRRARDFQETAVKVHV